MPGPSSERVLLVYLSQPDADYQVQRDMNYGMKRVPQLGLQYLSAALAKTGVRAKILDQALTRFGPREVVENWRRDGGLFVGFYTDTSMKDKVLAFLRGMLDLAPEMPLVVGGPGYPGYEDYHAAGVDIVCHGEGERTVVDIAAIYRGERSRADVPGISYREAGSVRVGPPRELIADLDELPFPDRDGAPIGSYYDWHFFGMRTPFVTAMAARGCPNKCTFCCSPALGSRVRRRSAPNVLAEVDDLVDRHGVRYVGFKDDIFVLNEKWLEELCTGLIDRGSPIRFSCNMHPLSFRNSADRFVPLMRRAGLDQAIFGIQTVNPRILRGIRRHEDEPRRLAKLTALLKRHGASVAVEFILGLPGDTEQTVRQNLNYARAIRPHYALFYALSVLEGSEIHREYGDRPVCDIPRDRLRMLASLFERKFFFDPRVLWQNLLHVLRMNPYWIWRNRKQLSYLIEVTGIIGRRKPPVSERV